MNPYIGQMVMFAGNFAPRGWALCDGQLLAINQYQALFSLLGTIYGGDGRTTFALPDMRGRVPLQAGKGSGLSTHPQGSRGGAETTTILNAQMPPHNHAVIGSSDIASQKAATGGFLPSNGRSQPEDLYASAQGTASNMGSGTTSAGGGQPMNNMEPYSCINYIIALEGSYPSRS